MKERRASQKLSSKAVMDPNQNVKCKIVVVGDSQCGKTALLHVFAKDCFPEVSRGSGRAGGPGWGCGAGADRAALCLSRRVTSPPSSRTTRPASRSTRSASSSACGTPPVSAEGRRGRDRGGGGGGRPGGQRGGVRG